MKIYLGTDHNGLELKNALLKHLEESGYEVSDQGAKDLDPGDDFPVYASRVVVELLSSEDKDAKGILLCGSGQGMFMAANRFKGIRASLAWDNESARTSRNDDDSNILCLPAKHFEQEKVFDIVDTWLKTPFAAAPRFIRRLKEIDEMN